MTLAPVVRDIDPQTGNERVAVFEDLIADFTIEEGREPDLVEMAYFARRLRRYDFAEVL